MKSRFSWELILIGAGIIFFAIYLLVSDSPEDGPFTSGRSDRATQTETTATGANAAEPGSRRRGPTVITGDIPDTPSKPDLPVDITGAPIEPIDLSGLADIIDFGEIGERIYTSGSFAETYIRNGTMLESRSYPAAGLKSIQADADIANLRLLPHAGDQIEVRIFLPDGATAEKYHEVFASQINRSGDRMKVELKHKEASRDEGFFSRLRRIGRTVSPPFTPGLEILVPEGALTIGLGTRAGNVEAGYVGGDISLSTHAGNITAGNLFGTLSAETSAGNIRVDSVDGRATLRTMAGNIRIRATDAHIEARTSAGNVELDAMASLRSASLETRIGNITVRLPEGTGYQLNVRGTDVSLDREFAFAGDRSSRTVEGRIGDGGPEISLNSRLGSVRVDRLRTD